MTRRRWSDPDELLEEWARLSALAVAPERFRRAGRRSVLSAVGAVAGGLAVLAVGLVVVAIVAQQLGGMASRPGDVRVVELPTHRPLDGSPTALLEGRLVREGECIRAEEVHSGEANLVIWPSGTTLHDHEDGQSAVVDRGGRVIASIGEIVRLGGGQYNESHLEFLRTLLATDIPDECLGGPYWLATSVEASWGEPGLATWRIDPSDPPSPESTSVAVLLTERACAGGRSPEGRILPPDIAYQADRIVISLSVRSWPGDCPSNPEYRLSVELDEPIEERVLVDGNGGGVQWPLATPTRPTPMPSPTPVADGSWDEFELWLGDYHPIVEALRELSQGFPPPAAGEPPAAMTLTTPLFDRLAPATLRQLDEDAASGGLGRMSERAPGFWLGDVDGAVDAFGAQGLVEDGDAFWLVLPEPDWHARRLRGFITPAGHEAWVMDEALVAYHDCALLVVPPFRTDGVDVMDATVGREQGFVDVYIFAEGDSHVLVTVRHTDPACQAHPVMGPMLEDLLSDD